MTRSHIWASLTRTLPVLGMLLSSLAPTAGPVAAQVPPSITFTPDTVPPGGTVNVTGNSFGCPDTSTNVQVDLYDSTGTQFVTTLGTAYEVCNSFNENFTIPLTVETGQYRIRGSRLPLPTYISATSQGLLTVGTPGSLAISGVAQCPNGDGGFTVLPNATVDLFSGNALVGHLPSATASVDANGHFSFPGAVPGALYQLRYTSNPKYPPTITCGTTANTTDGVTIQAPPACPDQTWDTAAALDPRGAQSTDILCKTNGSIWRKVAVQPGQQISITVDNVGPHTRVALFKDLKADLQTILSNPNSVNVQQVDASMNGLAGSPWSSSPWSSSPWSSSPWSSSPWSSSPWSSSPWSSSPWSSSPVDPTQLCSGLHLNVTTDTCSGAYITVQIQDLMAWSANGQITKNTFDLSGDFYIRVYNDDGAFDTSRQLTIVEAVIGTCGAPQESGNGGALTRLSSSLLTSPTTTSLPGGKKTLILTDTARLMGPNGLPLTDASNATLLASFRATVNTFAQHPAVGGLVVDFATDGNLTQDYAQWDTPPFPSCPAAANIVSSAIHDLINAYRLQSGTAFQYVTILGGHTVVPYHLTTDTAEIEPEDSYNPGLLDQSKSAASLADSFVMTDSYYVSFTPINHVETQISLPDANMAVGRLVEFPSDIMAVLQAFIDNNGVARPTSALVTGYTFTKDLAAVESDQLTKAGLTTDSLISDTWTAPDLRAKLFGTATPGIVAINWHARSNEAVAADYATNHPTTISSSEITGLPAGDTRFKNALIISIGCHLAYPLLDQDVIPNPTSPPQFVTDARAFTESFASRGAMVLGNSGYGYGDTDFVGYSEELLALVTSEITDGAPGNVSVGLALTNAKRKYIQNSGATTGVDKKSLEELTFYGPPMWSVGVPTRVAKSGSTPLGANPVVADSAHSLFAGTVTPPYSLTQQQLPQASGGAAFFQADHAAADQAAGTQQIPYQPILPFKAFDASSTAGTARGVALIAADYTDTPNSTAAVDVPATEVSGTRPPFPTPGFWPFETFGLNKLAGQELVATPVQWQSDNGTSGRIRQYSNNGTTLRVYYSNLASAAAAAGPASIGGPALSLNGPRLHVDLPVSGSTADDIFDVLVNYTVPPPGGGGTGHWKTCSLMPNRTDGATTTVSCPGVLQPATTSTVPGGFTRHYSGDIDPASFGSATAASLNLAFQVVTNTGLVSTRNNDGLYFSFVPETATIGNPKASTSVSIGTLPSPITYGLNSTFTANLSANRTSCSTANQLLTFNIGSQVQTARTDGGGTASVTFNVLEVPANYALIVNFAETQTCLGSSDIAPTPPTLLTVRKEATSLAFGTTPYVAILKDANNTPMRERWVYFNFAGTSNSGAPVNATRAAQTDANGIAQLHGMTVPAGTYTVKATFPGTIPTTTGTVQLNDAFYLASNTTTTQVTADTTAPSCALTSVNYNSAGVATSITVTVQDSGSGLASVNPTSLNNGTFSVNDPTYTAGRTTPLIVTVTKTDLSQGTQVTLQVLDVAGNVTNCDPEIIQVGRTKDLPRRVRMSLPSTESTATIYNGTPGVTDLQIKVNNKSVQVDDLKPGETRSVDLSDLMNGRRDQDRVTVLAHGPKDGTAVVIFSDDATNAP